jgi:uncharacterized membrane protein YiaA
MAEKSEHGVHERLLYSIFGLGGFYLVLMVIIAFKALIISRKVEQSDYKKGLISLGVSYFFLTGATVVLIISILVDTIVVWKQSLIVAVIILLGVAFYFVYEGFVKPTGAVKTNEI